MFSCLTVGPLSKATLAHYSSKLKCGVSNFGISNWVTFLENTAPVRRANRRLEYGDESDPVIRAFLERISPLNNAEKISVPLFITHGENDTRVTVHEAVAMYKIVRDNPGGQAQLVICEGEGHGERWPLCFSVVGSQQMFELMFRVQAKERDRICECCYDRVFEEVLAVVGNSFLPRVAPLRTRDLDAYSTGQASRL